jgi:hypothetical protein
MSNFSHLYGYLDDLSGPEYEYLGHFNQERYLECGHNTLGIEEQIDAGNIPDLQAMGKNTPAESEPGNISQSQNAGASEGQTRPASMPQAQSTGVVKGAAESIARGAVKKSMENLFDL